MDIAFFAPLSKFHFFQGTDESPLVAKITDNTPIIGCQLSPQMTSETWIVTLHGCCLMPVCATSHTTPLGACLHTCRLKDANCTGIGHQALRIRHCYR